MKKILFVLSIVLCSAAFTACNNGETTPSGDTTVPLVADSMPVVNPGAPDTTAIIRTPPTGDSNVIIIDSARANKTR